MRTLSLLTVVAMMFGACAWITAQDGSSSLKRPLDLPSGGLGDEEDDENSPETITFYGANF